MNTPPHLDQSFVDCDMLAIYLHVHDTVNPIQNHSGSQLGAVFVPAHSYY